MIYQLYTKYVYFSKLEFLKRKKQAFKMKSTHQKEHFNYGEGEGGQ